MIEIHCRAQSRVCRTLLRIWELILQGISKGYNSTEIITIITPPFFAVRGGQVLTDCNSLSDILVIARYLPVLKETIGNSF